MRRTIQLGYRNRSGAALSPDGRFLAVGSWKWNAPYAFNQSRREFEQSMRVELWDLQTGRLKWTHSGRKNWANYFRFSSDGKMLTGSSLSAMPGSVLSIWKTQDGSLQHTFGKEAKFVVNFLPGGRFLTSSGDGKEFKMWKYE